MRRIQRNADRSRIDRTVTFETQKRLLGSPLGLAVHTRASSWPTLECQGIPCAVMPAYQTSATSWAPAWLGCTPSVVYMEFGR
jgi:hypothetical protein